MFIQKPKAVPSTPSSSLPLAGSGKGTETDVAPGHVGHARRCVFCRPLRWSEHVLHLLDLF